MNIFIIQEGLYKAHLPCKNNQSQVNTFTVSEMGRENHHRRKSDQRYQAKLILQAGIRFGKQSAAKR